MMSSEFIINVSEADFEYEVINYSQNVPVVVDFWASWCRPCKVLEPILEKIVAESNGAFRVARVNVDENPNLALRFSVRSVPTLKAFSEGQVVGELVGLQPEPRLREFIEKITPPSPLQLAVERAESFLAFQKWSLAEQEFRQVLEQKPDHPNGLLGLAKSLMGQGKGFEALEILDNFPPGRQYATAELLKPYAHALVELHRNTLPNETDLDITFAHSIKLAQRGNFPVALDGLLEILRQDRHYGQGKAHKVVLSLLELMGEDNPQTRQYRSELASALF